MIAHSGSSRVVRGTIGWWAWAGVVAVCAGVMGEMAHVDAVGEVAYIDAAALAEEANSGWNIFGWGGAGDAAVSTPVSVGVPTLVTLKHGQVVPMHVDVPPQRAGADLLFVQVRVDLVKETSLGFAKVHLSRGTTFKSTVPGGEIWEWSVTATSETTPGDVSGRWNVTLAACGDCAGSTTSSSTFNVTVTIHDFREERRLFLSPSWDDENGSVSHLVTGSVKTMWYVDTRDDPRFDPTDPFTSAADVAITVSSSSDVGGLRSFAQRDFPPTNETYDARCPFDSVWYIRHHCTLYGTQQVFRSAKDSIPPALTTRVGAQPPPPGMHFILVQGCNDCPDATPHTRYNVTLVAWMRPRPEVVNPSMGAVAPLVLDGPDIAVNGAFQGVMDYFYFDLASEGEHAKLHLTNVSAHSNFKIVAKQGALPTLVDYDAEAPVGNVYGPDFFIYIPHQPSMTDLSNNGINGGGGPSERYVGVEVSAVGRWYVGVLLCAYCSGDAAVQVNGDYTIHATSVTPLGVARQTQLPL